MKVFYFINEAGLHTNDSTLILAAPPPASRLVKRAKAWLWSSCFKAFLFFQNNNKNIKTYQAESCGLSVRYTLSINADFVPAIFTATNALFT